MSQQSDALTTSDLAGLGETSDQAPTAQASTTNAQPPVAPPAMAPPGVNIAGGGAEAARLDTPPASSAGASRTDAPATGADAARPGTPPDSSAETTRPDTPAAGGTAHPRNGNSNDRGTALLADEAATDYRARWGAVQIGFVDEPRSAVEHADALVAEVMQQLARHFAEERSRLEAQWTSGEQVGTEELRLALQRYRSFFQRLLEQ